MGGALYYNRTGNPVMEQSSHPSEAHSVDEQLNGEGDVQSDSDF